MKQTNQNDPIYDSIRKSAENIPIPESLTPEKMEQKINESRKTRNKYRSRLSVIRIATAAAALLLIGVTSALLYSSGILRPVKSVERNCHFLANEEASTSKTSSSTTYETLRKQISDSLNALERTYQTDQYELATEENAALTDNVADSTTNSSAAFAPQNDKNYSDTNVQVNQVDEGDIVKTDGSYIYTVSENTMGSKLTIYKAAGKETRKVTSVMIESTQVSELYLRENTIIAIGTSLDEYDKSESGTTQQQTVISLYDIEDINNPRLYSCKKQSGNYTNSRMNGDYLYTISYMYVLTADKDIDPKHYIPSTDGELLPEDKLYCPSGMSTNSYVVFTSLNIHDGDDFQDKISVLGADGTCYASEKNLYIAAALGGSSQKTVISKFSYDNGTLEKVCDKTIRGSLLNQFSLDEYNGKLRFVSTLTTRGGATTNGLYILDEQLELLGYVDNLAKSETIYSARFSGDTAYFVTYRETDPLFAADLSDPTNPVIKDSLKIPGFSEYLHVYGEGRLLGIGMNENNGSEQVKLSMFDVSSPKSLQEENTQLLNLGTHSLAGENHKALLVSPEKNLIGFAVDDYYNNLVSYYIFSYDSDKGFRQRAVFSPENLNLNTARCLYIDDMLYLVDPDGISGLCVYQLKNFHLVKKVTE